MIRLFNLLVALGKDFLGHGNLNSPNFRPETPLPEASVSGNPTIALMLLSYGRDFLGRGDINSPNFRLGSPAALIKEGDANPVRELLLSGAQHR